MKVDDAGFSLLDTLIALAITAFVGIAATAALFIATRAYASVRDAAARTTFVMDTDRTLRSILDRLAVSTIERHRASFSGTSEQVALATAGPDALLSDSVGPITIRVARGGAVSQLSLERPGIDRGDAVASADAQLRFDYFGSPSRDEAERWLERWERPDAMPRALRLTIAFAKRPTEVELVYRLYPHALRFCLTEQCLRTVGE